MDPQPEIRKLWRKWAKASTRGESLPFPEECRALTCGAWPSPWHTAGTSLDNAAKAAPACRRVAVSTPDQPCASSPERL